MAFRRASCVIAVCDLCGTSVVGDGFSPHLDTEAEAVDYVLTYEWQQLDDGRLICEDTDRDHEQAREHHGQVTVPDSAMTVTFEDIPNPPYDPPLGTTWAEWLGA
jgi:hypothetical protein